MAEVQHIRALSTHYKKLEKGGVRSQSFAERVEKSHKEQARMPKPAI